MKPLKPIDQYDQISILKEVKERFGSISNFNKITRRCPTDLYYLQHYVFTKQSTKKYVIESVYKDIIEYEPKRLYLDHIDCHIIRNTIKAGYETVKAFSDDHPEFSTFWVSTVI